MSYELYDKNNEEIHNYHLFIMHDHETGFK